MVLKVIPVAKDTFSTNVISSSPVLTFATFRGYEVATTPFEPSDCGDKTDPKGNNSSNPPSFPALETITKPTLKTAEAAYYLGRSKQTLRCWACYENGPLRPIRVNGRLEWPLAQMKKLLGVV